MNSILLEPREIRRRSFVLYDNLIKNKSDYFTLDEKKWGYVLSLLVNVMKERFPSAKNNQDFIRLIPPHSRLRHFEVSGKILWHEFNDLKEKNLHEWGRTMFDLVMMSALLDAGAGAKWKYESKELKETFIRSEGLGVATFEMFRKGLFSSDPEKNPHQVSFKKLMSLTEEELKNAFQDSPEHPLEGLSSRLELMCAWGKLGYENKKMFGDLPNDRPGRIFDWMLSQAKTFDIELLLKKILQEFHSMWPQGNLIDGEKMGDVWQHRKMLGDGFIPFHKISQWLTYSLLDVLQNGNFSIMNENILTGLPEYRNGGLFLDLGLLNFKDHTMHDKKFLVSDEPIVEWRALTVALLDELHIKVCQYLDLPPREFTLAKVLEGGSWWAGRKLAFKLRPEGISPLKVTGGGTLF